MRGFRGDGLYGVSLVLAVKNAENIPIHHLITFPGYMTRLGDENA